MSKLERLIKEKTLLKKLYRKSFIYFIQPVLSKFLYFFPIQKKKIVFDNFGGKGFGDNPKYIANEILKRNIEYDLIWLVDNLSNEKFPQGIRAVKIDSIRGLYERATAQIWIDNIRHLHPVKKKSNQLYLQTWHAPFSAKCIEKDAESRLSIKYIKEAKYDGRICNGILANSKLQELQYKRAFWLSNNCEILRFGLPRNDALVNAKDNIKLVRHLKQKLNLLDDCYYILYAPTFRDDYSLDGYMIDCNRVIEAFENRMERKCKLIIRLHPNVATQSNFIEYTDKVINGTFFPDIQELSIICDIVISDYSTSVFDFALLNKPAIICALDLEYYKEMRGLLNEFQSFPFPKAKTNDELIDIISSFDFNKYAIAVDEYFDEFPFYDKGDSSKKIVDWLLENAK